MVLDPLRSPDDAEGCPELRAREFGASDLGAVLRIEAGSFPSAWTGTQFRRFLATAGVRGFVAELAGRVAGFHVLQAEGRRLHVLNLAVEPALRRRGVASFMLRQIEALARSERRRRIDLEVRETNLAAQLLYRKAGYRAVEILRRLYDGEDGYRMRRELPSPAGDRVHR